MRWGGAGAASLLCCRRHGSLSGRVKYAHAGRWCHCCCRRCRDHLHIDLYTLCSQKRRLNHPAVHCQMHSWKLNWQWSFQKSRLTKNEGQYELHLLSSFFERREGKISKKIVNDLSLLTPFLKEHCVLNLAMCSDVKK